jgi:hypothetical protein
MQHDAVVDYRDSLRSDAHISRSSSFRPICRSDDGGHRKKIPFNQYLLTDIHRSQEVQSGVDLIGGLKQFSTGLDVSNYDGEQPEVAGSFPSTRAKKPDD